MPSKSGGQPITYGGGPQVPQGLPPATEHQSASSFARSNASTQPSGAFDFHALRVQCASSLARGGAHPAVAQARMRHSTIEMTMNLYTKLGQDGQQAALDAMPKLTVTA